MRRDFVLYIWPFGLVKLRTFRLVHGLVRCKHERRCAWARGEDVSSRDVKIKIPDRNWDQWFEWHHAQKRWRFGGFEKSQLSFASEEELSFSVRRRRLTFGARRGQTSCLRWGPHVMEGKWKSQYWKIVYLSPYVELPLTQR